MTAPVAPAAPAAPAVSWLLPHATACAEAVATALDLLDTDDVRAEPDGAGFTLRVDADPPRPLRALRWTPDAGWEATADPARRRAPHWWALPVEVDADPLALCEVVRAVAERARAAGRDAGTGRTGAVPVRAPRPHRPPG